MTCVAMLNGETPVEGEYRQHLREKLRENDSDDDSDYSVSNAYESVRKYVWVLFV